MNAYMGRQNVVRNLSDNGTVGATVGATVPLYRAPEACEILNPYFVNYGTAIAGGVTADYFAFSLLSGGTPGTALDSISSTVSSSVAAGWSVRTPVALTMNSSKLAKGEWLVGKFNHVGSGLVAKPYVSFEVVLAGYNT